MNKGTTSVLDGDAIKCRHFAFFSTAQSPEEKLHELWQSPAEVWRCRISV